jgi:hypothetical protein
LRLLGAAVSQKITEIYCFCATEEDGGEGIPAFSHGNLMLPMVGADKARIESLKSVARMIERQSGRKFKLLRFTAREELEW